VKSIIESISIINIEYRYDWWSTWSSTWELSYAHLRSYLLFSLQIYFNNSIPTHGFIRFIDFLEKYQCMTSRIWARNYLSRKRIKNSRLCRERVFTKLPSDNRFYVIAENEKGSKVKWSKFRNLLYRLDKFSLLEMKIPARHHSHQTLFTIVWMASRRDARRAQTESAKRQISHLISSCLSLSALVPFFRSGPTMRYCRRFLIAVSSAYA